MPFVTEVIWQQIPAQMKDTEILMVANWPTGKTTITSI
jgi:valyl-tRNA synthetase